MRGRLRLGDGPRLPSLRPEAPSPALSSPSLLNCRPALLAPAEAAACTPRQHQCHKRQLIKLHGHLFMNRIKISMKPQQDVSGEGQAAGAHISGAHHVAPAGSHAALGVQRPPESCQAGWLLPRPQTAPHPSRPAVAARYYMKPSNPCVAVTPSWHSYGKAISLITPCILELSDAPPRSLHGSACLTRL